MINTTLRARRVFGVAMLGAVLGTAWPIVDRAATPLAAEPAQGTDSGDAAKAWTKVKDTTKRGVLEAFVGRFGDTLYGELARDRWTQIRLDANQPVFDPPSEPTERRTSAFLAKADRNCRVAASYYWGRDERSVRLWSVPSGQPVATISLPFEVRGVAVAEDKVAVEGPDSIRLYNIGDGSLVRTIDKVGPLGMFFSTDGRFLLAAPAMFGFIAKGGQLLDVETGAEYPAQTADTVAEFITSPYWAQPHFADCPVEQQQIFPGSEVRAQH
jgi:hypothetical protein